MHSNISKALFFLNLILVSVIGSSQNTNNVDFQTWTDYNLVVNQSDKFVFGGDAGIEGLVSKAEWNQFYIRPYLQYYFNHKFNVKGGLGSFNTIVKDAENIYEVRLFQDFNVKWPDLGYIELIYRLRFEERWFTYKNLPDDFEIRSRFLIGFETAEYRLFTKNKIFYNKVFWEGFEPLGGSDAYEFFVNQSRLNIVLACKVSTNFRVELHYISQQSRQFSDSGLKNSQNIIRLRVYQIIF